MDRSMATEFRPRDFIETSEGFIFAVVDAQLDEGRLTAYLRYLRVDDQLLKLSTQQAKAHLAEIDSDYVFFSRSRDTWVQAVPVSHISAHHVAPGFGRNQAGARLSQLHSHVSRCLVHS